MLSEASGFPIGGNVVVGLIGCAVLAYFGGQVVGERTIAKSNWDKQCKVALLSEIEARRPAPSVSVPKLDCNSILGMFGADGKRVCRQHGNFSFDLPGLDQLREIERRKAQLQEHRLSQAAAQTGSRCTCAVSVTLEEQRLPLAIYAGTARLVTPQSVKSLNTHLIGALHSSHCAHSSNQLANNQWSNNERTR